MSFWDDAVSVVTSPAKAVVNLAEDGAKAVVNTVENGVNAVVDAGSSAVNTAVHGVGQIFTPASTVFETAAHGAMASVGHMLSTGWDSAGGALKAGLNFGVHAAGSVLDAGHQVVDLGVKEASTVLKTVGNAAVDFGQTVGKDASHAFTTVKDGVSTLGSEAAQTAGGLIHAAGDGLSAIGKGAVHITGDIVSTGGKVVGDLGHTAGNVLGDIAHGNIGQAGKDVIAGVGKSGSDVAHGVDAIGHDAGQAGSGLVHAGVEAGSAAATGLLNMTGTAAGVVGSVAKDYEHSAGDLVKNAVDVVGQIAKSEVSFGYGTAGIAAHTVGTPVGDFYANVFKHYSDAANATLDHVRGAIDDAVVKGTTAGGDMVNSAGHGVDVLTHDSSKVIGDISRGDFTAAAHDAGQFGKDALQAGKDFGNAEGEGVKALAAIATGIGTVMNGLNEAMARAGGGFVSAVGETVGGKAGHGIADAGDWLGDKTAMTADLAQGNFSGAAVEGAKVLGGMAGQWVGDHVKDWSSSLGDKVGGVVGDGIKELGNAGADGIKDGLKDLAGTAAGKGIDVLKGGDDPATKSDDHGNGTSTPAKPDQSFMEKVQHTIDDAVHHKIDQAGDIIQQVAQNPQWLLNQISDAVKDHFGKPTTDALNKLLGTHDSSHASGDAAHASDGTAIATTHAALTSEGTGSSSLADHGDGHSQAASAIADAFHAAHTAASVIPNVQASSVIAGEWQPLANGEYVSHTGIGGDAVHGVRDVASAIANTQASSGIGHDVIHAVHEVASAVANTQASSAHSAGEPGASAGHDMQAALQSVMHIFSDAQPHSLSLDGALASLAHGVESGHFTIGGHEVSMDSLAHVTLPQVADFLEHMPAHSDLPSMLESHFAHHHM